MRRSKPHLSSSVCSQTRQIDKSPYSIVASAPNSFSFATRAYTSAERTTTTSASFLGMFSFSMAGTLSTSVLLSFRPRFRMPLTSLIIYASRTSQTATLILFFASNFTSFTFTAFFSFFSSFFSPAAAPAAAPAAGAPAAGAAPAAAMGTAITSGRPRRSYSSGILYSATFITRTNWPTCTKLRASTSSTSCG